MSIVIETPGSQYLGMEIDRVADEPEPINSIPGSGEVDLIGSGGKVGGAVGLAVTTSGNGSGDVVELCNWPVAPSSIDESCCPVQAVADKDSTSVRRSRFAVNKITHVLTTL